jgi:hypothetical protein
MRVFVEASLLQDEAYTVDDLSSACLWFPPGWEMSEAESVSFEQEVRAAAGEYAQSLRRGKTYLPTLKPAPNATAASMNVSGSVFRAGSTCQMVLH